MTLLERLRQPEDGEAWRRLVHLYGPLLFAWADRAGLQESDAADLVQDVFSILWQKLPEFRYDAAGSFRGWLKTVTMNKLRDRHRRDRVRQASALSETNEPATDDPAELFWEREYHRVLLRNALNMIEAEFAPEVWSAGTAFLLADSPARDVASRLGVTENAVYIAKCRVQRRLREVLAGLME